MKLFKPMLAVLALFSVAAFAGAQTEIGHEKPIKGMLTYGAKPIVETLGQIAARQAKLKPGAEMQFIAADNDFESMPPLPNGNGGLGGGSYPGSADPFNQEGPNFATGISFPGPGQGNSGFIPPDTMGGVSPTQIFIPVNGWFAIYNKSGVQSFAASANTFFASVRNASNVSDPRVWFDKISQRWFICAINVTTPNRVLLAVSSSATLTNNTSFSYFQFNQNVVAPAGDASALFDYPLMGIDANGIYIGGNMFAPSYTGSAVFVVNKNSLIAGSLVVSVFRNVGFISPMGVNNDDPAATNGLIAGVNTTTNLRVQKITNVTTTPVLSAALNITVPTLSAPGSFPSPGNTLNVDNGDTRTMDAQIKLDRISNTRTLWLAHGSRVTNTGAGSSGGDRNGTRFYEVTNLAGTPTLRQSGTLFDAAAANKFTYGSVVMNGQGHAFVGATRYSATEFLGVAGGMRLRTATLGSLGVPQILQAGAGNYQQDFGSGRNRWGDYSMTVVDPADDQTFWTFQEYASAVNTWSVRCVQVFAPAPASITTLSPNTIAQGATANIVVTGTSVAGTEFFDPGAGFIKRIAAALSGTGLTVNSVTFTDPTHVTLNVTATGAATLGARNLTITNPDGQTSVGTGALTVVTSGNPVPTLSIVSPTPIHVLSPSATLTVTGTNFVAGSVVRWNGSDRVTTFGSSTSLTAALTATDLNTTGSFPVTVFNPAPGGGTSGSANVQVAGTTLNQVVTLLDHISAGNRPVTVELRNVGSTTPLQTFTPTLSGGSYSIPVSIAPGNYDVAVRGASWLRKVSSSVSFSGFIATAPAVTLTNGDVDGNNVVDLSDYTTLVVAFNGGPGPADLNGDGTVDLTDYTILVVSFNAIGDN
ncbi:MAG: hypothetical protein K8R88_02445 [Armatimonadetes bacterium]|nr:hypothetical protein [Armatimonadota bacterium]